MSLLHEIQAAVLREGADLAPILLKLRLLAARIGSQPLAEWVRHESEGYPRDTELPDYRLISVSYTATFTGPFGSGIQNAPISPYLIKKFAGEHWVRHKVCESIAAVDDLLANDSGRGEFGLEVSDLILKLQGKVYADYACNAVNGHISRSSLAAIRHAVRSRVLELTIELEKSVPDAAAVTIGPATPASGPSAAAATQIAHAIIYGNYTSISNTGDGATVHVAVNPHDTDSLRQFLAGSGVPEEDAQQVAALAASESPGNPSEPIGPRVQGWLTENLKKASSGAWKISAPIFTEIVKQALLKYYGLK